MSNMATLNSTTHIKGLKLDLLKRKNHNKHIKKANSQELLHNIESLRTKVIILRQQCEEIRTQMNKMPTATNTCNKCGQQLKPNEALTFKTATEKKAFCKNCFAEMWK
jgi:uncharacterized protein YlxW (UPF0749 family)